MACGFFPVWKCREWRASRRETGENTGFPAGRLMGGRSPFASGALVSDIPCVGPVGGGRLGSAGLIPCCWVRSNRWGKWDNYPMDWKRLNTRLGQEVQILKYKLLLLRRCLMTGKWQDNVGREWSLDRRKRYERISTNVQKKIKNINLTVCLNSLKLETKRLMVTVFVVCSLFLPTGQNDKSSSCLNCTGLPMANVREVIRKVFKRLVALLWDIMVLGFC